MTRLSTSKPRRTFVVEHYRPGLSDGELRQLAERVRDAVAAMGRAGRSIRYVSSTLVPEDDYFQTVVEATSERVVRDAHERAGVSFERISVAIPIEEPPKPPPAPIQVRMLDAPFTEDA
jgi:Protein of unknown function (DUF4242)